MTVTLTGDWAKLKDVLARAPGQVAAAARRAVLQEAHHLRNKIVEGIREQAPGGTKFKPISPLTAAARKLRGFGGTKALIDRGDLRNAIKVVPEGSDGAFVGVHKSAVGKDGQSLVNIASVHEYGMGPIIVRITPAMRRYLAVLYRKAGMELGGGGSGGTGVVVLRIPPRPFIGPVWKAEGTPSSKVGERFQSRFAAEMGGDLGSG